MRPPKRLDRAVVAVAAVASARLGLRAVGDNSTLVHLRTGIDLVNTGHVPHHDPYSFTAAGHSWVVQSWLASVAYGVANAIGHHALVLEQGLLYGVLGAVMTLTARSSTWVRTALAAVIAICASTPGWSPRPLMFALVCLALTILITERRANPLWLLPVVWVWANTHGSFPLGLAWIGATVVGDAIDRRAWPAGTVRYLGAFLGGLVVSLINPVGPQLLTFPLVALHKKSTFQNIVEWRSPNFQDPNTFVALVFIAVALVILLRAAIPWRSLLPVVGFLVLGLVAVRNLNALGVVLAPALALALAGPPKRPRGTLPNVPWAAVAWAGVAVAAGIFTWRATTGSTLDLHSYPVAATDQLAHMGRLDAAHRIAAVDVVGCYLIWRAGPQVPVFIDDRYDMYPASVVSDAATLGAARGDAVAVLDRWHIDTVLWATNQALPGELLSVGGWRQAWSDGSWAILVRS